MSTTSRAGHELACWLLRFDLPPEEPSATVGLVLLVFENCYDDLPWQLPQELVKTMSSTLRAEHDSGGWLLRLFLSPQEPGTTDGLVLLQFEECCDDLPCQLPQELVKILSSTSRAEHDSGDWFFRVDLPPQEPSARNGPRVPQFEECYDDHPWQLPQELVRGGPAVVPALRRVQRLSECRRGTNFTFPTST